MDREEIKKIIPHRDNMLLLDRVENEDGVSHGYYLVKGDEFFLKGHFPNNPIVPGVILCEILAQSTCALFKAELEGGKLPVYTSLNNVKFRSSVRPGDLIETKSTISRVKAPFYFAKGELFVKDRLCVSAEFSFAIVESN